MGMLEPELICVVSSANGIYVPMVFAERYRAYLKSEQHYILTTGPDHEDYWPVWEEVLDTCKIGNYYLYNGEDGDIFLVPDGYIINEYGEVESTRDEFLMGLIEKINWN